MPTEKLYSDSRIADAEVEYMLGSLAHGCANALR
jgi:hypothetical protein